MAGASFRTRMVIKNTPENVRAPMQDIASNAIKGLRDVFTSHMRDLTVSARENAPSGEKWYKPWAAKFKAPWHYTKRFLLERDISARQHKQ